MGRPVEDRWKVVVISPVNNQELWSITSPTLIEAALKWRTETGNDYVSKSKLTRATLGKSKNELIQVFKVGNFDLKNKENKDKSIPVIVK
jgi:hypothetical protein